MIKWSKSNEFHPGTERGTACTSLSKLQDKVEAFSSCSSTEKDAFLKALGWLSSSWRYLEGTQKSHTCLASLCSRRATDLLPPVSTSLPRGTAADCRTLPQVCERRAPGRDASDNPNRQQLQNFWIHRVSFYFFLLQLLAPQPWAESIFISSVTPQPPVSSEHTGQTEKPHC